MWLATGNAADTFQPLFWSCAAHESLQKKKKFSVSNVLENLDDSYGNSVCAHEGGGKVISSLPCSKPGPYSLLIYL